METVNFREAVNLVKQAIAEKGPDYVTPEALDPDEFCYNFNADGSPSCIIGHVYQYAGLSSELFLNRTLNTATIYGVVSNLSRDLIKFTEKAKVFLADVQSYQDRGITWSDSYKSALRVIYSLENQILSDENDAQA